MVSELRVMHLIPRKCHDLHVNFQFTYNLDLCELPDILWSTLKLNEYMHILCGHGI